MPSNRPRVDIVKVINNGIYHCGCCIRTTYCDCELEQIGLLLPPLPQGTPFHQGGGFPQLDTSQAQWSYFSHFEKNSILG